MLRQKIPAGCDGDVSGERVAREVIAVFHLKIADLDGQIASADGDGDRLCLPGGAVRGKGISASASQAPSPVVVAGRISAAFSNSKRPSLPPDALPAKRSAASPST